MTGVDLRGTVVMVTGANSVIGAPIARRFAEVGASVVAHARAHATAGAVMASLPGRGAHVAVTADLTNPGEVEAMFAGLDERGGVDVLINNAGAYPSNPFDSLPYDEWTAVLRANLDTTFLCIQRAARSMIPRGGGGIVNIASLSAHRPALHQSHYNASKAAVIALTRSPAVEYAPQRIRVNSVSPGLIERPGIESQWPEGVVGWTERAPLGRLGTPTDVANACLFLASPLASWITGHDLVVDGGISATPAY